MVPILTLMKVRQAALAGLGQVVRGQWPELLLHPALLIVLLVSWRLLTGWLTADVAMLMTVASSLLMLGLGAWLLHQSTPPEARHGLAESVAIPWRSSVAPLVVMATIQALQGQAGMLVLGLLAPASAVGVYGQATRGATLVVFFLNAALPAVAPVVADLYEAGDRAGLEKVVQRTARTTTMLSLPVALGLIVFGRWFLAIFGPAFVAGAPALAVLCVAQMANVAYGPVGTVLIMTGHERVVARVVGIAAIVNIVVSVSLIPRFGIMGSAIGSAVSVVLWNVMLAREAQRRVGVDATCFGGWR
jgi:O-antigen/teichoic acid export membrane protein